MPGAAASICATYSPAFTKSPGVSELDKTNQSLRSLFIDLHAHVETLDGEPARRLEASIWQELSASVQRRLPALVGMATAGAILEQNR